MTHFTNLSKRESQVANLVMQGQSNKLIAATLHITESTVEFHLTNIFEKFQVASRVELILKLGESTVADKQKMAENEDQSNSWNWLTSFRDKISSTIKELNLERSQFSNNHSEGRPLTFFESINVCFSKYANFSGNASRSEFWWFALFILIVGSALTYINENVVSVFLILILLPFLAVGTRRLHEIGKSGWWLLYLLIPIGGIVLLAFLWAEPSSELLPENDVAV